ncbi:hypothetical protein R6L23_04040 [Streptomyces sp. SR27]|uniref:hypothetical protein n=1 Tax=Streptomyces sp. SR27 TaxID=3076630 RepID=UPI00295BF090|nr:hypothetical protein [Streptomyces sp. SR27]MDV9187396.1 hypothetical protein [Streptomyces sp. SR27]
MPPPDSRPLLDAGRGPQPVPPDDPAFRAWLRGLSGALHTFLDVHFGSPEALAFFQEVFTGNGAVPAPYFVPLLDEHRRIHAERTVTALLAQVRRDTGRTLDVPVVHAWPGDDHEYGEPVGEVSVGHEPVRGVAPADIAVDAAEGVQCLLADRDRLVWPLCPDHRTGPHATRTPAGAVWVCSVTEHVVAPIPA